MQTEPTFQAPSRAQVERVIAQAHQMRADHTAKWIRQGLSAVGQLFVRTRKPSDVTI